MQQAIEKFIKNSLHLREKLLQNTELLKTIENLAIVSTEVFLKGGRMLLCGNGGSAADAQHLAAELSGRYKLERVPLDAEALHVNTSYLTAVANDYSFDIVYERLVQAKGRTGDVLIAISTSGNSGNIIRAIDAAKRKGMIVAGMTGSSGGKMGKMCDYLINVPSDDTPCIQEMHIMIGHILCECIENSFIEKFKKSE